MKITFKWIFFFFFWWCSLGRLEASNREADHKCEICVKESGGFEQKGHMKKKEKEINGRLMTINKKSIIVNDD